MKSILASILIFFFCVPNFYGQTIADSLKVHYTFDNNLKDVTKYGNHLMISGGISPYVLVAGKDSALTFNGADRLTSTSVFDASSFTEMAISVWIKTSTVTTSADQLIFQGANIGFGMGVQPVSGKLFASFDGSTAGSRITSNSVADGNWHNIVMQNDGNTTSLYVDGVFDGSVIETLFSPTGGADNLIYVGASTFNTRAFTGAINDLRIYNRLLSKTEIETLFFKSLSVTTTPAARPEGFSVFPNPSSDGHFSITADNLEHGSSIEITDITGRMVWQALAHAGSQFKIEATLQSGIYMVSAVKDGTVRASRKLIIQ